MKALKHTSTLLMVFVLSLFLVNCEKVNPEMDLVVDPDSEIDNSQLKAAALDLDQSTIDQINYLYTLIEEIEELVEEGQLNKGNANALIVKIENSIKSLEKGNDNAAENQLSAFINEAEDYVENGILNEEQGEELIDGAEIGIILTDGSFVDPRDGNEYKVVLIGDQLWMAENLRATTFNDGTEIPQVTDISEWESLTTPAFCWYDNNFESYGSVYGALYDWYVVESDELAPEGWHVPSIDEWNTLSENLGGYAIAGGKLKEDGTLHWLSPNTGATNETGFTALPSGLRYTWGGFSSLRSHCYWWTSSLYFTSTAAWNVAITWLESSLPTQTGDLNMGMSVRCVKD